MRFHKPGILMCARRDYLPWINYIKNEISLVEALSRYLHEYANIPHNKVYMCARIFVLKSVKNKPA